MDAGIIHISIFWCKVCDRTDQGRQADRAECISCNDDRIVWIYHFVWQILLWICLRIWNLGRWNVCLIPMGSEKSKKKLPWVSEETGRKLQKMKYIVLLVLMLIYALGFTKKFHGTSPWEVFSMLYTGKIPDASYLAGWVIFVLILVGMCLKERFFCQYLCPMGAIFAWLPTLPFSVLDRDRSNCIPKCRACEIKCPVDYQIKRDQKNAGECIHCMQCMDVCPKQNIHLGSGKKLKGNEIVIILILLKLVLFIGVCIFAQSL